MDPGAGALVFGSFQALEAAKTQDCCSKMHVRKCCFSCPPNYYSAGGMIERKEKAGDTPAAASAVADIAVWSAYNRNRLTLTGEPLGPEAFGSACC